MDVKLFPVSAIRFWEAYLPIPKRNASNSEKNGIYLDIFSGSTLSYNVKIERGKNASAKIDVKDFFSSLCRTLRGHYTEFYFKTKISEKTLWGFPYIALFLRIVIQF